MSKVKTLFLMNGIVACKVTLEEVRKENGSHEINEAIRHLNYAASFMEKLAEKSPELNLTADKHLGEDKSASEIYDELEEPVTDALPECEEYGPGI